MKSTSECLVVQITELNTHPFADKLELTRIFDYTVVVQKGQYKIGDKVCYIPPDSVVNTDLAEFSFLKHSSSNLTRIKAKKLRNIVSFGLLIPAASYNVGDNLMDTLGITHYEPETEISMSGDNVKCSLQLSKYDVDTARKYKSSFVENEPVFVLEKLHGSNSRYTYHEGVMCVGSRSNWKADAINSPWYIALRNQPFIEVFCRENQNLVLFGEVYGTVGGFKYGLTKPKFAAFDIFNKVTQQFLDVKDLLSMVEKYGIHTAPIIGMIPFDFDILDKLSNGPSLVSSANHIREGICFRPMQERYNDYIGRVHLKLVGSDYLCI